MKKVLYTIGGQIRNGIIHKYGYYIMFLCSQVVEDEKVINSQFNKTKSKIKNLLTAIENGASEFSLIKDRLKELQEEKEKLQLQLE